MYSKLGRKKKSPHETATSEADATVPVAATDWDDCVRMCAGDPKFTCKILSMMAERAELHRARGGVCYLKLPQLEQTLKAVLVQV